MTARFDGFSLSILMWSDGSAVESTARAQSLRGKRSIGYCQRSRGEDANRAYKKERDFEPSPRLVAGQMRLTCCSNQYAPAFGLNR
jgi:hypothetical protein